MTIFFDVALEQARAGATLVTASRRLARTLQEQLNALERAAGRAAWEAPAILPWSAWVGEVWDTLVYSGQPAPLLLDENQEAAVWERAIAGSPGGDGLLQLAATAKAAAATWELVRAWRLDAAVLEASATDDTRAFLTWTRAFTSTGEREGWIDRASATDYLAARLAGLPLPERIILAGFDELTPQQREFLAACPCDVLEAGQAPGCSTPAAVRSSFPDSRLEIDAAARWASALLDDGETGIAVVIRNLDDVRDRVERTFASLMDRPFFNMAVGPALASFPLVRAALLTLDLGPGANEFDLVSRLLRSPFLGAARSEWSQRASLEAALRRGANRVSVARIERLAVTHGCPDLAASLAAWRRERESLPAEASPPEWARAFSTLLTHLGWPGEAALASAEYQTVKAWRELLSDFAKLGAVLAHITYSDALSRLNRMAAAKTFQPESGPAPIQILEPLDTFGMRFDHLWIAGLDDEHWPGAPNLAAFLPPSLQRARGLPHASPEREFAFAARITGRLLASAPDVVVSYASREGDFELGPSPLIAHLPQVEQASASPALDSPATLEKIEDSTAPPYEDETAPGGTRVFQYQAQCPFRAFAELRLGAVPLDAPAPGLSPMERGTLVHKALETVWDRLGSHARLCAATESELGGVVEAAVADALAAIETRRSEALPEAFAAIEQQRLERLLGDWLELEKRRTPFTVLASEKKGFAEAGGVRCEVRVDRVDRLEDGRHVIIDYKSGQPTPNSWFGDRPDEPQLPLYAVSHQDPLGAVLFGQLRAGETVFKGYAAADGLVPGVKARDLDSEVGEWRRVLDRLGADFRAGVANVDPKKPATCRHCTLLALCRFSESEAPAAAFETEDGDA